MRLTNNTLYTSMLTKAPKHGVIVALITIVALFTLVLAGCSASGQTNATSIPQANSVPVTAAAPSGAPLYDENAVVSLYERAIPAVVEIKTVIQNSSRSLAPFQSQIPNQVGQGSGFFIDGEGHILTNNHVVDGASTVTITMSNGKIAEAKVVGTDRQNDLALLQVNTSGLDQITFLTLGNSDILKPGQMAIALGTPYGLQGSVTVGVISGVRRSLPNDTRRPITNVIQTDAAINPGNSGGPLLNSKGEVIGINTAIEAQANSIGFAVPVNTARALVPKLLKGGQVKNPWLGIEGIAIDQQLSSKLSLPVQSGVYVVGVITGSPAERAGLKESGRDQQSQPIYGGDIITAVDNVTVTKVEDMVSYFNGKQPGDTISLSIVRGDKKMTVSAVLGEWPDQTQISPRG
jgi:S1-C subfamily serine protease